MLLVVSILCFFLSNGYHIKPYMRHFSQRNNILSMQMARIYNRNVYSTASNQSLFVLDDFDQILESIVLFQQYFGDCKIPLKFEVPADLNWPFHLHGLRLGKRLEKLMNTPEFFNDHPEKVERLRSVGFEPRIESLYDEWNIFIESLRVYKEKYGDVRPSVKFVVPDTEEWPRLSRNFKLGLRAAAVRSACIYIKDHPERKDELDALGFEWKLRDHNSQQVVQDEELFQTITQSLSWYKEQIDENIQNIFKLPANFVIPEDSSWPATTWNLPLGQHIKDIQNNDGFYLTADRVAKLHSLGIEVAKEKPAFTEKRFQTIYQALEIYKSLHGNLLVPQSYVVPACAPWPEELWDLKLGTRVSAIRCQGVLVANYPERRQKLTELGFVWEMQSPLVSRQRGKSARDPESNTNDLSDSGADGTSSNTYGDTNLSASEKERMIEESLVKRRAALNQQKLDSIQMAKNKALDPPTSDTIEPYSLLDSSSNRPMKQSNALSFEFTRMFDPSPYREMAAESIRDFMKEREYSSVPEIREKAHFEGFLTPYQFGQAISYAIEDQDVNAMKSIGYRLLEFGEYNWNKVVQALEIYKQMFGHVNVPVDFVITEELILSQNTHRNTRNIENFQLSGTYVIGYDASFEGMPLGEAVASIRVGDVDGLEDPIRKEILDSLGFDWGDISLHLRFRFVPMVIGLRIYKHLYGDSFPQASFVVPDEPQWPYWMCNMILGEWAAVARVQQRIIANHYPDRKELLDDLNFRWWVPPGNIPKKYFKPLVNEKTVPVHVMHRNNTTTTVELLSNSDLV